MTKTFKTHSRVHSLTISGVPDTLHPKIKRTVAASRGTYRSVSHFMVVAATELVEREKRRELR